MNKFVGPLSVGDGGDSDVEALQTDVMRFLSIIALCLLAVFAAVSSEPPPAVKEMIKVQEAAIGSLEQALDEATERYNEKLAKLETENQQLKLSKTELSPDSPKPMQAELDSLKQTQNAMRVQMQEISATLELSELHNRKLESLLEVQKPPIESQAAPIEVDPEENIQPEAEAVAVEIVEPESAEPSTTDSDEEKGFTLAFESDEVLLELVRQGRVALYARSVNQLWQLEVSTNKFIQVAQVSEFFELGSVPSTTQQQAQRQLQTLALEWGVSFDKALRASLNSLFADRTGGDIVVQRNGGLAIADPD